MRKTLRTNTRCSLDAVIRLFQESCGTEYNALAKCNCIVNLITTIEVYLRKRVIGEVKADELLEGDFTINLLFRGVSTNQDRELLLSLLEIRNSFVHEGMIINVTDQEVDRFIHLTRSILTT